MWPELAKVLAEPTVVLYGSTSGWAAWLAAQLAQREVVVLVAPDDQLARRL
jgi:cysteine synthase